MKKCLCSRDFKYKKCCLLSGTENMKKSKVTHEIDDFLEGDDSEHVVAMLDFMKMQHSCALELTKLIIDKCHDLKFTKDTIFAIFNEAAETVATSVKNTGKIERNSLDEALDRC